MRRPGREPAEIAAFRDNGARFALSKEERIGFGSYDPVRRFPKGVRDPALGDLVLGAPAQSYVYGEATFLFANEADRQEFVRNPKKFIAGVGGYCLNSMRNRNTAMVVGDPHYTRFVGGMWSPPRPCPSRREPISISDPAKRQPSF